jgi:hypothetical protein
MFDGSLWMELLRARCMYDLATSAKQKKREAKWRSYVLKRAGNLLITFGQQLKANARYYPPYELVEDTQRQ